MITDWSGDAIVVVFVLGSPWLVLAIGLLVNTSRMNRRARTFNQRDWATANALHRHLEALVAGGTDAAHAPKGLRRVTDAVVVEAQRHFDTDTTGTLAGSMTHQLSLLGHTVGGARSLGEQWGVGLARTSGHLSGMSDVQLQLSSTTRTNLTGDALFAVVECPTPTGTDTWRVVCPSAPAVQAWVRDLASAVRDDLGGLDTHAGSTMERWAPVLAHRFATGQPSYASDRLVAMMARPVEQRPRVSVSGQPIGRNVVLAATIGLDNDDLELFPVAMPALLRDHVSRALEGLPATSMPLPVPTTSAGADGTATQPPDGPALGTGRRGG